MDRHEQGEGDGHVFDDGIAGADRIACRHLCGIYVAGAIHDHRIDDLTASQYTAMHLMRDRTFARVMPVVGLVTLLLVAAAAAVAVE